MYFFNRAVGPQGRVVTRNILWLLRSGMSDSSAYPECIGFMEPSSAASNRGVTSAEQNLVPGYRCVLIREAFAAERAGGGTLAWLNSSMGYQIYDRARMVIVLLGMYVPEIVL